MLDFIKVLCRLAAGFFVFFVRLKLIRLWPPPVRPVVTVKQGKLRGVTTVLPNGAPYHYFKGIPYAEAPVGKLRFRPPVALESYRTPIVECLTERSDCIQADFMSGYVTGSEGGLYLNVFTPVLPPSDDHAEPRPHPNLPVMVYIHGGGFMCGSGSSVFYNPEYFLQQGVIVVTMNYRLGPMGFLSFPSAGIPGNAGLKDQLMALRWVNQNISRFGGNAGNVTLFGESAGSMSTYLHYLSPNSRKFFHRAICQSGVACSQAFFQNDATEKARKLAQYFGYTGNSDEEALELLQNVPARLIAKHQNKVMSEAEKQLALNFTFRPVIEQELTDDSIITQAPEQILKTYDTIRMPLIEGCNDSEGILALNIVRKRYAKLNQQPERYVPLLLGNSPDLDRRQVGADLKKFFLGDRPASEKTIQQINDIMSDNTFITNSVISAEWIAKHQPNAPHYHYRFTFDGRYGLLKRLFRMPHVAGACHGDDIFYMFNPKFLPKLPANSDEERVREIFVALWTSFAKHGDPSQASGPIVPVQWKPVDKIPSDSEDFNLDCLVIDTVPKAVRNPCEERIQLWRGLLKKYRKGYL